MSEVVQETTVELPDPPKPDVPVGISTLAALVTAVLAGAGAVLAFVKGDRSEQTLGVIAGGVVALLSLIAMITSRTVQAKAQITAASAPLPPMVLSSRPIAGQLGQVLMPDGDDGLHEATDGLPGTQEPDEEAGAV